MKALGKIADQATLETYFQILKKTILVRPFEIGWDYTRVAVLQYSDDPRIEFYLKDYQDKTTLLDAIDTIPYKGKVL